MKRGKPSGNEPRKRSHLNAYRTSKCKVCGEKMLYKSLIKHFDNFHKGESVKEDYGTLPLFVSLYTNYYLTNIYYMISEAP